MVGVHGVLLWNLRAHALGFQGQWHRRECLYAAESHI